VTVKKGRLNLPSEEYFDKLLQTRLIASYDVSPRARVRHDEEIRRKYGHKFITHEERAEAWRKIKGKKKGHVLKNNNVVNPWVVGGV